MTMVKFNPTRSFARDSFFPMTLSNMLDQFSQEVQQARQANSFTPKADISESEDAYMLELAMPGMKKEDLGIEVKNDVLTISGERKWESEEKKKAYIRVESHYGHFSRSFTLPENTDKDSIEAQYEDGILKVRIGRKKETGSTKIVIR